MPLRLALGVWGTVAGHRLGALKGQEGYPLPPPSGARTPLLRGRQCPQREIPCWTGLAEGGRVQNPPLPPPGNHPTKPHPARPISEFGWEPGLPQSVAVHEGTLRCPLALGTPWTEGFCPDRVHPPGPHPLSSPQHSSSLGNPTIALRGGGDGMGARRRRGWGGGGGVFQKWASVPGPLFCLRTDVAAKGTGTQILARKSCFHKKIPPPTNV